MIAKKGKHELYAGINTGQNVVPIGEYIREKLKRRLQGVNFILWRK